MRQSGCSRRQMGLRVLGMVIVVLTLFLQSSLLFTSTSRRSVVEKVKVSARKTKLKGNVREKVVRHKPPDIPIPPLLYRPPQERNGYLSFEDQALRHNLSPYQAAPLDPQNYQRLEQQKYASKVSRRLLHFVFVADLEGEYLHFNWINYLVIRAAYFRLQPDSIYLHTNKPPLECPIWVLINPMIDQVKHFEPELEIFGNKVSGKAHISDIQRLRALQQYGGIYMDIDSVALRYFPDAIWSPSTGMSMGYEDKRKHAMGVSMISCVKDSKFLQRWIESYRTFNDKRWADHTVKMGGKLARKFPTEINTLPEEYFNRPLWNAAGIKALWEEKPLTETRILDFKRTLAQHYWGTKARDRGKIARMTPYTLLVENVAMHQILRPLLPYPYFSLVLECRDVKELRPTLQSIIEQKFGLWEIVVLGNHVESQAFNTLVRASPRLLEHTPKSVRLQVFQSTEELLQSLNGVWMIRLQPAQTFQSSESLTKGLEIIRDRMQEASYKLPLENTLEMSFVYNATRLIKRLEFYR